jgi:predicted Zn-dependent protease
LAALALWSVTGGCFRNPVTQRREAKLISEAAEKQIGAESHRRLVEEYGEFKDPVLREFVASLGTKIASLSDRPKLEFTFTILDADLVNAFAVPGGYIYVTRGLLEEVTSEAELAVVLGHEIGHVCAWHSINMIEKQMGYGALTTLGAIVSGFQLGPEAMLMVAQTADLFTNLYLLGYSREYELEADRVGLRYAISAGYNPAAALSFFERLDQLEKQTGTDKWESYFRSHPPTADRIRLSQQYIDQMSGARRTYADGFESYQELKRRLPESDPEAMGREEGRVYRHPGWGVTLEIPESWRWEPHRRYAVATFREASGEGWGELRRQRLGQGVTVANYARLFAAEKKWSLVQGKQVLYPAGYGFLGHYYGAGSLGGAYQLRALFVVRGGYGYAVICGAPPERSTHYLIAFEQILRSFTLK